MTGLPCQAEKAQGTICRGAEGVSHAESGGWQQETLALKAVVKGGGRVFLLATGLRWAGVNESSKGCCKTRSLRVKSVGLLVTLGSFMGQLEGLISFLYPPTTS